MIAVDAMGGDRAPYAIVEGAVAAARKGVPILLCGNEEKLRALLPSDWQSLSVMLKHTEHEISMDDEPVKAIRSKKNAALMRAMQAVVQGEASAFFSAGNSGAVLVAGVVLSGRVPGIHRPAVGAFLPGQHSSSFCIDVGGNVDCKASYLYQFALMGHAYVSLTTSIENPRIGLLSNGHEAYKGSREVKKAYEKLSRSSLNFIGNIEARDMSEGTVDVVVCDGFVGNITLKVAEGTFDFVRQVLKEEIEKSWVAKLGYLLMKGPFKALKERGDYTEIGGAPLLGVQGTVVICHGSSKPYSIRNAIRHADNCASMKLNDKISSLVLENQNLLLPRNESTPLAATG
jgi:glycerol-3-phosphate acyltransferase PlsX